MFGLLRRIAVATTALTLVMSLAIVPAASAATVLGSWSAKVGTGGANGTARIQILDTGAGSLSLKLAKLKPSSLLSVILSKGTCGGVGPTVLKLSSIRTSSRGAAIRTTSLSGAQANAVKSATKGTAKTSIRIGSGSTAKCGTLIRTSMPPRLDATISVGRNAIGVAIAPNGVLVANWYDGTLSRVDPTTNSVLSVIPLTESGVDGPQVIAFGEGAVWVGMYTFDAAFQDTVAGSVERLDPVTDAVTATIPVGRAPVDITTSPGAVWVANRDDGTVTRIDPTTNQVAATITLAPGVAGVSFAYGSLWVSNDITGSVSRIDPTTNVVAATIPTVGAALGIIPGAGAIWVANWGTNGQPDGVVSRIDPASNLVTTTIPVGTNPIDLAFGGGSIWVVMGGEPTIVQVNAFTSAVIRIGAGPTVLDYNGNVSGLSGIVATDHVVWATQDLAGPDANTAPPLSTLYRVSY